MNAKVQNQVARAGLWFTGFFILAPVSYTHLTLPTILLV